MVQEQLVDYISSQMKLGVSRDAIKSALVSAGWVVADVEDTLKKVDGGVVGGVQSAASSPTQPVVSKAVDSMAMGVAAKSAGAGVGAYPAKSAEPQMIRVSDLVSASPASSTAASGAGSSTSASAGMKVSGKEPFFNGKISGNTFQAMPAGNASSGGGSKKSVVGIVIAVVLVLVFAGLAGYFYMGNAGLAAQVASLTTQSASVATQLTTLQSQVDASSTGLAAQVASLTAANADLALNLSFYAAPVGGASSTTGVAVPVTISGWLSGGTKYAITTPRGAKIVIANSADAKLAPQLKPLIGDTVQLDGTYIPGSDEITVNTVTDLSPALATTTTMAATTTIMTATSTATSTSGS